jgi:oxygen-independent coproporphyrinogen-3 oxidase
MVETSIYLHIPFCRRRCGYCDFNTFAGISHMIPAYVKALCTEIEYVARHQTQRVELATVFFGGGTPSLLSVEQFQMILSALRASFAFAPEIEITSEANPGTVTAEYLAAVHEMGVTRMSFGMQSPDAQDLAILNRQHRFEDVVNAVMWSKQAGFKHLNLDLIFAIPAQTLERWRDSLRLAVNFGVDHLSLYGLTIEEGTPLFRQYQHGLLDDIDEEVAAQMFIDARSILAENGFKQYEISNFAREGGMCRHNWNTWNYQPYFGLGAGAHGFIDGVRTRNVSSVAAYIQKLRNGQGDWPAAEEIERILPKEQMREWMFVGLRKTEVGVSRYDFEARFGMKMDKVFPSALDWCQRNGLVEEIGAGGESLRLTARGRLLGNQVFMQFLAE